MLLYSEQPKEVEKIYDEDLQFMAEQLMNFIKIYKMKVYMDNEKETNAIVYLEQIALLMKNRQYGSLITDTSIIDYSPSPIDDWPF